MRLLAFVLVWLASAFGEEKPKERFIELSGKDGVEVLINYTTEIYSSGKAFAVDVHIREIFINANGKNKTDQIIVFFNDNPLKVKCIGQLCRIRAKETDFKKSLFTMNIHLSNGHSDIKSKNVLAAFKMNGEEWLENKLDSKKSFALPFFKSD